MVLKFGIRQYGVKIFIFVLVFFLSMEIVSAAECGSFPTDRCVVTRDTIFSRGVYFLPGGISIISDKVNLDCNGSVLDGNHSFSNGITFLIVKNSALKNCYVKDYERANLLIHGSKNNRIENSVFEGSLSNYGAHILNSRNNTFRGNDFNSNRKRYF